MILGIIVGGFVGVGLVALIVVARNDDDPKTGWAWIDVVSISAEGLKTPANILRWTGLCCVLCQALHHARQVHASSPHELPE